MSASNGQPFSSDTGPSDQARDLLGSMASAWSRGMSAWQNFASMAAAPGGGSTGREPDPPLGTMLGQIDTMMKSFGSLMPGMPQFGTTAAAGQASLKQAVELSPAIAQACLVGASSAIRYQSALAELVVEYGANLMRAATDRATGQSVASPADCRVVADDMRAFIRGVGEAATREARRLEHDLGTVSESIAQATDSATPSPHPYQSRRRHEMKP